MAIEEIFSGPVAATRTPFDTVVALGADPQTEEGREALFELRFPEDLARFTELLPLVPAFSIHRIPSPVS